MGLKEKLLNVGSPLSVNNGNEPAVNPLSLATSKLHTGYSINGTNASEVNSQFAQYNDGVANILPQPSQLDLASEPTKYLDNLPT
jgi:hypothetical protein